MRRSLAGALFAVVMITVVVAVDALIFRHHFWERLAANAGIVLLAVAFYFRYLHRR